MRYGLALGSNLGDRRANLIEARRLLLEKAPGRGSLLCASLYESSPVGCAPGAAPFLNSCMEIEFDLSPAALLALTRGVEIALGRPDRRPANAPRTIDIDILYAGDQVISQPGLRIPHPRLAQRRFVLAPLAEIRPDLVIPGEKRTIARLLSDLDSDEPPLIPEARSW